MKHFNFQLDQINEIARHLWHHYHQYKIWAFHAPMGAGKTTFIHALCSMLQVSSAVSSPTFAIINEYASPTAGGIFHMDWYRIKDETEAIQAGCEDCIESGNFCLIEWSEKFPNLLPENTLHLTIEVVSTLERKLVIHSNI